MSKTGLQRMRGKMAIIIGLIIEISLTLAALLTVSSSPLNAANLIVFLVIVTVLEAIAVTECSTKIGWLWFLMFLTGIFSFLGILVGTIAVGSFVMFIGSIIAANDAQYWAQIKEE